MVWIRMLQDEFYKSSVMFKSWLICFPRVCIIDISFHFLKKYEGLWLIRMSSAEIARMHGADFIARYSITAQMRKPTHVMMIPIIWILQTNISNILFGPARCTVDIVEVTAIYASCKFWRNRLCCCCLFAKMIFVQLIRYSTRRIFERHEWEKARIQGVYWNYAEGNVKSKRMRISSKGWTLIW